MKFRNHIAIFGIGAVLALVGSVPAGAEPSSAIQYAPGPIPRISEPRYAEGTPRAFAEGLPESTRDALTGAAGRQLQVVATAPQFGAPNGAPIPKGTAGPDLLGIGLLIAALAVVTALIIGLTATARPRRGSPASPAGDDVPRSIPQGKALLAVAVVAVSAGAVALAASGPGTAPTRNIPAGFFGIAPQSALSATETSRMSAAGITSIRVPVPWSTVQPNGPNSYDWRDLDQVTEVAAENGLEILPFLYSTPAWVASSPTALPVDSVAQERAWAAFLRAAVRRYGPDGSFWREHGPDSSDPLEELPIRNWQIWNEANLFYFASPVSPERYGRLVLQSREPIQDEDPEARIILSGLFGSPRGEPPRAMDAATFLRRLYRVEGIGSYFDVAALHPYARDTDDLSRLTAAFRNVMFSVGDAATPLWITEMGWGSARDTAFEKGPAGQADQLDAAYTYLLANRGTLNLERAYWFTWKDDPPPVSCNFCDSAGLFGAEAQMRPKPAWFRFVEVTGGSP